jgi:hypothetical protein
MIEVRVLFDTSIGKWAVMKDAMRVSSHDRKQNAEKRGRREAKNNDNRPSELVVERKDGTVTYTQRYE